MVPVGLPPGRILIVTGKNGSGKTRWLEEIADRILATRSTSAGRLICLSGTVLDRFPFKSEKRDDYAYLGRQTNNNMFSEFAPYRALMPYLLMANEIEVEKRGAETISAFEKIGLGDTIQLYFQSRRYSKLRHGQESESPDIDKNINTKLSDPGQGIADLRDCWKGIAGRPLALRGVRLTKSGQLIDIANLSSGERHYAISLLGVAFCMSDYSTVLYDEPENSLHPAWQASIVADMWRLMNRVSKGSRLIVATHSPLVISGAPNTATLVFDMEDSDGWKHSSLYGNSSDTVLKNQFHLYSPRAMSFLSIVNQCLKNLIDIETDPVSFIDSADQLIGLQVHLDFDDPLYRTVQDILEIRERMS